MTKTNFAQGVVVTPEFLNAINNPVYSSSPNEDGEIPYPDADGIGLTAEIERATLAESSIMQSVTLREQRWLHATLGQGGVNGLQWKSASGAGGDLDPISPASLISSLVLGATAPGPLLLSIKLGVDLSLVVGSGNSVKAEIEVPLGDVELELRQRLLTTADRLIASCAFIQSAAATIIPVYAEIYVNEFLPDPKPISIIFRTAINPSGYMTYSELLAAFSDHSYPVWINVNFSGVI